MKNFVPLSIILILSACSTTPTKTIGEFEVTPCEFDKNLWCNLHKYPTSKGGHGIDIRIFNNNNEFVQQGNLFTKENVLEEVGCIKFVANHKTEWAKIYRGNEIQQLRKDKKGNPICPAPSTKKSDLK